MSSTSYRSRSFFLTKYIYPLCCDCCDLFTKRRKKEDDEEENSNKQTLHKILISVKKKGLPCQSVVMCEIRPFLEYKIRVTGE